MLVGYARVSTSEQDLSLQLDALKRAECERIFQDKASGSHTNRPGLQEALSYMRQGDVLVVWKLDRIARSLKHLLEIVAQLEESGIEFKSIQEQINTTTSHGRFFFNVMGALAQMERELIIERTQAGLAAARARGRLGGRPRKVDDARLSMAKELIQVGKSINEVAELIGVHRSTLYRRLKALDFKKTIKTNS
jgi:DNA invertase Pin-like site-specific DNA recombinase